MNQLLCWVAFPLVLALLSLGCGLLLERAAGRRLAEPLVLPIGLAVITVVAELTTKLNATARFTTPAIVVLALIGFALARPWRVRPRIGVWPLVAAVAVYLVYLAPVLLTGEPTFTGYIKLDDTATWMAMTDQVFSHGHDLAGLAPSTYQVVLRDYLHGGEPVGAFLAWGVGHQLVGEDLAWVFQPYLALLGGMLALSAWPLAGALVRSRPLRALVVFVAAQSALIYGYSLWGGIKEVAAAWLLPLIAACALIVFEGGARPRSFLPLAMASFGILSVLAYGGAVWLALVLVVVALVALRVWARKAERAQVAALAALAVAIAIGLIVEANKFLKANQGGLTGPQLGNLMHPLSWLQLFGIWPAGDFRFSPPRAVSLTHVLIVVVLVAACFGLFEAWRRRAWGVLLYPAAGLVGTLLSYWKGSPWVVGKALATTSPAFLLVGLAGFAALLDSGWRGPWERGNHAIALVRGRRAIAAAGVVAVVAGVLWSNVLAYGHVTIAPYAQLHQLEQIGDRFAGDGPTLLNEYQPYGDRHFLRNMDAESPSELRVRLDPLLGGGQLPKGGYADLDQFQLPGILVYRTIVERTSPTASRPPAPYQLVFNGTWYQVWQRPVRPSRPVLAHLGLGNSIDPAAVPACSQVQRVAREAGPRGLLAAVARPAPSAVTVPSPLPYGTTTTRFAATAPGLYELWLGGSFWGRLTASVDGVKIGSIRGQLNETGEYTPLGRIRLGIAPHRVDLVYGEAGLEGGGAGPGPAGPFFPVGPLLLAPVAGSLPVTHVRPSDARSLCGRAWDWVEALGPS